MLLKRLADAIRDGDKIHAVIRGLGTGRADDSGRSASSRPCAADSATPPRGPRKSPCWKPTARARPAADRSRSRRCWPCKSAAPRPQPLLVGSVVGQIGHAGGASGMASLLKAVLEIEHGEVPRTVGIETPLPSLANGQQTSGRPCNLRRSRHSMLRNRPMAAVSSCSKDLVHHVILEAGAAVPTDGHISTPKAPSREGGQHRLCRAPFGPLRGKRSQPRRCRLANRPRGGGQSRRVVAKTLGRHMPKRFLRPRPDRDSARPIAFRAAIVAASPGGAGRKNSRRRPRCSPIAATWPVLAQRGIFCREMGRTARGSPFCSPGRGRNTRACFASWSATCRPPPRRSSGAAEIMRRHNCPTLAQIAWSENPQFGGDVFLTQLSMLVADAVMLAAIEERGIRPAPGCRA